MASWEIELHKAVFESDLTSLNNILVKEEVKNSGKLSRKEWEWEAGPLHSAAFYGYNDIIEALVEAGIDVNSFVVWDSDDRCTALHWAAYNNQVSSVQYLLQLGADVDLKGKWDVFSGTPLDFARQKSHTEITDILEAHLECRRKSGVTLDINSKKSVEEELNEALDLQEEINIKIEEISLIDQQIQDLNDDVKSVNMQMQALVEKMKNLHDDTRVLEDRKSQLSSELLSLRDQPTFRSENQIHVLSKQLEGIQTKDNSEAADIRSSCPICFESPEQVFSCLECENWVCGGCKGKLEACPSCREDFLSRPPRRNKGIERVLGI